jgi:hypothetical protein
MIDSALFCATAAFDVVARTGTPAPMVPLLLAENLLFVVCA